jgi:hypothetical protein
MRIVCALLAAAILGGCSSTPKHAGIWDYNLETLNPGRPPKVSPAEIQYAQLPFTQVSRDKEIPGYEVVGVSQFTWETLEAVPGSRQSSMREAALKLGAQRVEWGKKSLGVQPRQGTRLRGSGNPAPPLPPPQSQASQYRWESTTQAPTGTYTTQGTVTPYGSTNSLADSMNYGFATGQYNAMNAMSMIETYTYEAEVFEYVGVYYRRTSN